MRAVEFKVTEVEVKDDADAQFCIVNNETIIEVEEEPLKVRNLTLIIYVELNGDILVGMDKTSFRVFEDFKISLSTRVS